MDAKSSYEKINYSLRPAKNIERKMLVESFQKLSLIQKINQYRYIGFGSTFFADFYLFHRVLGIKDLISIEKDKVNEKRFEFNKPFSCINLKFGNSKEVLPKMGWKKKSIVWLDYDCKLEDNLLDDIDTVMFNLPAGSIFIITVDVKPDKHKGEEFYQEDDLKTLRWSMLKERVSYFKIPAELEKCDLDYQNNPSVIYHIINSQIVNSLETRNGGFGAKNKNIYKQLYNFLYDDGTLMLTLGGIIYNSSQQKLIDEMEFEKLDYIRLNDEPFIIEVPKLTFKEINLLDSCLPTLIHLQTGKLKGKQTGKNKLDMLKKEDIKKYTKIYRYFPNFAEASF